MIRINLCLFPFCPLFSSLASKCHWPPHSFLCVSLGVFYVTVLIVSCALQGTGCLNGLHVWLSTMCLQFPQQCWTFFVCFAFPRLIMFLCSCVSVWFLFFFFKLLGYPCMNLVLWLRPVSRLFLVSPTVWMPVLGMDLHLFPVAPSPCCV